MGSGRDANEKNDEEQCNDYENPCPENAVLGWVTPHPYYPEGMNCNNLQPSTLSYMIIENLLICIHTRVMMATVVSPSCLTVPGDIVIRRNSRKHFHSSPDLVRCKSYLFQPFHH